MCLRPLQAQSSYFSSHSEETEHSLVSGIDDRASFSDDHGINLRCVERSRLQSSEGSSSLVIPSFGPFQLGSVPLRTLQALGLSFSPRLFTSFSSLIDSVPGFFLKPPRFFWFRFQALPLIWDFVWEFVWAHFSVQFSLFWYLLVCWLFRFLSLFLFPPLPTGCTIIIVSALAMVSAYGHVLQPFTAHLRMSTQQQSTGYNDVGE